MKNFRDKSPRFYQPFNLNKVKNGWAVYDREYPIAILKIDNRFIYGRLFYDGRYDKSFRYFRWSIFDGKSQKMYGNVIKKYYIPHTKLELGHKKNQCRMLHGLGKT
jgi:hypothetical protein